MRNFQDAFEALERSFISAFSICMTVPLIISLLCFALSEGLLVSEKNEWYAIVS